MSIEIALGIISIIVTFSIGFWGFTAVRFEVIYTLSRLLRINLVDVRIREEKGETLYHYADGKIAWHGLKIVNKNWAGKIPNCHVRLDQIRDLKTEQEFLDKEKVDFRQTDLHWWYSMIPHAHKGLAKSKGRSSTGRAIVDEDATNVQKELEHQIDYHIPYARYPACLYDLPRTNDYQNHVDLLAAAEKNDQVKCHVATLDFFNLSLSPSEYQFDISVLTADKPLAKVKIFLKEWKGIEDVELSL